MTYCYDATKGMKTVTCTMRCYNYKLKRLTICRFYITNKTKQENPFLNNTKQDNHFFTIGEHRSSFNKWYIKIKRPLFKDTDDFDVFFARRLNARKSIEDLYCFNKYNVSEDELPDLHSLPIKYSPHELYNDKINESLINESFNGTLFNTDFEDVDNLIPESTNLFFQREANISDNDSKHFFYCDESAFSSKKKIYPSFDSFEQDYNYNSLAHDYEEHTIFKQLNIWNKLNFIDQERFFSAHNNLQAFFQLPDTYDISITTGAEYFLMFFSYATQNAFSFFENSGMFFLNVFMILFFFIFTILLLFSYPKRQKFDAHARCSKYKLNISYTLWWYYIFFFFFDVYVCFIHLALIIYCSSNPFIVELYNMHCSALLFLLFWVLFFFFFLVSFFVKLFYYYFIKVFIFSKIVQFLNLFAGLDGNMYIFDSQRRDFDYIWLSLICCTFHFFFFVTFVILFFYFYLFFLSTAVFGPGFGLFPHLQVPILKSYFFFFELFKHSNFEYKKRVQDNLFPLWVLYSDIDYNFFYNWAWETFRIEHQELFRSKARLPIVVSKEQFASRFFLRQFFNSISFTNFKTDIHNSGLLNQSTLNNDSIYNVFTVSSMPRLSSCSYIDVFNNNDVTTVSDIDVFFSHKERFLNRRYVKNTWLFNNRLANIFGHFGFGVSGHTMDAFYSFITSPFLCYNYIRSTLGFQRSYRHILHCYKTLPLHSILFVNYLRNTSVFSTSAQMHNDINVLFSIPSYLDVFANLTYWNDDTDYNNNKLLVKQYMLCHQVLHMYTRSYNISIRNNTRHYLKQNTDFFLNFQDRPSFWSKYKFTIPRIPNPFPSVWITKHYFKTKKDKPKRWRYKLMWKWRNSFLSLKTRNTIYKQGKIYIPKYLADNNNARLNSRRVAWTQDIQTHDFLNYSYSNAYKKYLSSLIDIFFDTYSDIVLPVFNYRYRENRFQNSKIQTFDYLDNITKDGSINKRKFITFMYRRKHWYKRDRLHHCYRLILFRKQFKPDVFVRKQKTISWEEVHGK